MTSQFLKLGETELARRIIRPKKICSFPITLPTVIFCPYPNLFIAQKGQNIIFVRKARLNFVTASYSMHGLQEKLKKEEENIKYQHIILVQWI